MGPDGSKWICKSLFGSIWVSLDLVGSIWVSLGLYGSFWVYVGHIVGGCQTTNMGNSSYDLFSGSSKSRLCFSWKDVLQVGDINQQT